MRAIIKRQLEVRRKENSGAKGSRPTWELGVSIASRGAFIETAGMPTRRTVRVAEVLRKELSACMSQSLDLEGLLITISSVELPPDMRQAYVYVSTLNPDLERNEALKLLNRNRSAWQSAIGRRLGTKFTPQLNFRFDEAIERGDRVMEILTKLEQQQKTGEPEEKDE
jgi:ribosome-binding factor A